MIRTLNYTHKSEIQMKMLGTVRGTGCILGSRQQDCWSGELLVHEGLTQDCSCCQGAGWSGDQQHFPWTNSCNKNLKAIYKTFKYGSSKTSEA